MLKKSFVIIPWLLIASCGIKNDNYHLYQQEELSDSSEVIDLRDVFNHVSHSLDTLSEFIKIISLETSEMSVVSNVKQLITTTDFIYILDYYKNGSVAIFNIDGSFVKRLPIGSAAEEIGRADRMYYDDSDSILYIHDNANYKISKFTKCGDFISADYVSGWIFIDFAVCGAKYLLVQPPFQSSFQKFSVAIADSSEINYWVLGDAYFDSMELPYVQDVGDCILITKPKDDFVYCYDGKKVFKKYCVLTNSTIDYSEINSPIEVPDLLSSNGFVFEGNFTETSSFQFISVVSKIEGFCFIIRNRISNQIWVEKFLAANFFSYLDTYIGMGVHDYRSNVLNGIIYPEALLTENPDYRWDGSNPNNLISPEDMEKLKSVKPDDNPIIVLFKLKSEI